MTDFVRLYTPFSNLSKNVIFVLMLFYSTPFSSIKLIIKLSLHIYSVIYECCVLGNHIVDHTLNLHYRADVKVISIYCTSLLSFCYLF